MATIAELQTRLAAYKAAELEILTRGQAYSTHEIRKDRGNLETIQKMISSLESQISTKEKNAAGTGSNTVVFESPTT